MRSMYIDTAVRHVSRPLRDALSYSVLTTIEPEPFPEVDARGQAALR